MANPRAFKVRLRAAGAGQAVRGGIDAASVARSGRWRGNGDEVARSVRVVSARSESGGPVFNQIMGCAFQRGQLAEAASQNNGLERDGLSEPALKRKPHPILERGLRTKAGP